MQVSYAHIYVRHNELKDYNSFLYKMKKTNTMGLSSELVFNFNET